MNRMKQLGLLVLMIVAAIGVAAGAQEKKAAAKKPRVFFVEPKNNAIVTSPVHMKFGSEGITIAARRGAAVVAMTADDRFARAVATRVLRWDPASGQLAPARGWFRSRLG